MKCFQTVRSIVATEPDPKEHSPGMPDFKLTLVVACALIDADRRVLIAQRPEGKTLAGLWEFPGGKLEPGERP
jgi:8-oxo-dGTP diphosphatase